MKKVLFLELAKPEDLVEDAKVFSPAYGNGTVTDTDSDSDDMYHVEVVFGDGDESFTKEGKYALSDTYPSLYLGHVPKGITSFKIGFEIEDSELPTATSLFS